MTKSKSLVLLQKLILTIFLITILFSVTYSQGKLKVGINETNCPTSHQQADIWYFGQNAGIDFSGEDPVALSDMYGLNVPQGDAVISDSSGNLLFYTDGKFVYDRRRMIMPNGSGLGGNPGVTQPAIIVNRPGSSTIYYIFTVDLLPLFPGDTKMGFSYSEIDLSLNGGFGDVTSVKNKKLLSTVSSKVSAVLNSNMRDVWVMAHEWGNDRFVAYEVTESGVDTVGVPSNVGTPHTGDLTTNNFVGNMKFSHDGSKLAVAMYGQGMYEVFNFNAGSGTLSEFASGSGFRYAYGVEFSPNMNYLYGSTAYISGVADTASRLYQFDLSLGGGMFNNPYLVDEDLTANYLCALQLASDGRIYVARAFNYFGSTELGVIYNPDRPDAECNFNMLDGTSTPFSLGVNHSSWGLPNFMQSHFDLPHFDVDSVCFQDSTQFRLRNEANITSISWNFGDGNTGNVIRPYHSYTNPGDYTVTVTETYNGQSYQYSEDIKVQDLPFSNLGDTIYMYKGNTVRLDAGSGFESYEWSTGESGSFITVQDTGTYWVILQNERCCFSIDSVTVRVFDIYVPNAFRPGGANPEFRARPTGGVNVSKFEFYVFDRWGQNVFMTQDVSDGWDGNINGKEAPGDVYVWLINYIVENDGKEQKVTYKGSVVLLR